MDLITAALDKRAFRLHGKPLTLVQYQAQKASLEFLHDIYANDRGVGVLHGPALSGKTTVVNRFVEKLPSTVAVAVVDCGRLNTSTFLASILAQFGYEPGARTVNEQLNLLKTFLVKRTSFDRAPILIIENANKIDLMIYHCLGQLIGTRYHGSRAIRVVLVSNRSLSAMVRASVIHKGLVISEWMLEPMTLTEATDYVNAKLRAAGCDDSERIVPSRLINEIFEEAGGYPGLIDWSILRRLQEVDELPLGQEHHRNYFFGTRRANLQATIQTTYMPVPKISRHSLISASSIHPDAE